MDHNNLSHYVFDVLGQNWCPGVKKWPFRAKIGYTKKWIFLKNISFDFVQIAQKDTFWVNNNDEKMIGARPVKKFSGRPFFQILARALAHWQKLTQVLKIVLEGPKLP